MTDPQELLAKVARLERRLERERAARLDSEAIAEKGLRELYLRQQQLQLLEVIATAANQDMSVGEALRVALAAVSGFVGWPLAHAYLRDETGAPRLLSARIWHADDETAFAEFRSFTEGLPLEAGQGLPGRVLQTGRAAWMTDVATDHAFVRKVMARRAGLSGAFAFPILVGDEVVGVLEFFAPTPEAPQESVLAVMTQVGTQLGRIIERRRAQDQLVANNLELTRMVAEAEAQRAAAETANRAKTDFLAVTSHEIRTPLNAVLGLAEALNREPLTPGQRELVQGVLDGGAMLVRLLNAILDLSKIEAGAVSCAPEAFDLRRLAKVVVRVWSPKSEERGVRLVLEDADLPLACGLFADAGKLEQTLVNLLSNAVKFSPPGSTVRVRLAGVDLGANMRVRIEVLDQGPGVDPADRERIFRAFEQGDLGRAAGGTGLGLSICAGNMALLGGRVGVADGPEGGAVFWMELEAPKIDALETAEPPPGDPEFGQPLRILAAEDHPANRQVLKALLEPLGVELTLVDDGEQAVKAAAGGVFDLVLMDVNMPVMDGVAAVRALRAMAGPVSAWPIYMLTANAFEEDVRRYEAAGADGVLKKPINVAELFSTLEAVAAA